MSNPFAPPEVERRRFFSNTAYYRSNTLFPEVNGTGRRGMAVYGLKLETGK